MSTASNFRDIIGGRRQGVTASLLRGLFRLAEFPYTWEVNRRNRNFDSGRQSAHRMAVPVISVGNLTLGGTGKTPLVVWIAKWFRSRGKRVVLVSRGYKATAGKLNDEGRELAQKLPDVPHLQNPDRVAAAEAAIKQHGAEVILLDDGFQHRRLARNLDIVLIDALEPFGYGHVFPRGTLREPLGGLRRAQIALLTRADMVNEAQRREIRSKVEKCAPHIIWAECSHVPKSLLNAAGDSQPIATLRNCRVAAFCGIGNPAGFRHTLAQCGCAVVAWREFPDHHNYAPADVTDLANWAASTDAEAVVCTHKDLVKIAQDSLASRPLRAITVAMEFLSGQVELENQLIKFASKP